MDKPELTVTVSLSQKIGMPNYGSAECFLSVFGVTAETTGEEIDAMLEQGKLAWGKIAERVRERIGEMKGSPAEVKETRVAAPASFNDRFGNNMTAPPEEALKPGTWKV